MTPEARVRGRVSRPIREFTIWAWIGVAGIHLLSLGAGGGPVTAHQHAAPVPGAAGAAWLGIASFAVMVAGMMTPLLTAPLQHVLARTLPARRGRHLFLVVAAQSLIWALGMLVLQAAGSAARRIAEPLPLLVTGVAIVLVWEVSPARQRCVNQHHAHPPLAVHGRSADRSVLRYAVRHACWCLAACSAVMLLPQLTSRWHLPMMAVASVWMWMSMIDAPGPAVWSLRSRHRAGRLARAATRRLRLDRGAGREVALTCPGSSGLSLSATSSALCPHPPGGSSTAQ